MYSFYAIFAFKKSFLFTHINHFILCKISFDSYLIITLFLQKFIQAFLSFK